MPSKLNIAIIGAGIGGLAAALRLSAKGHRITVFEKSAKPGGKIGEIRQDGFRFDTGPSLFTLPELVDELIDLSQEHASVPFEYKPLDIICRYFYEDQTCINGYQDVDEFAREIEGKSKDTSYSVLNYLKKSETIYTLTKDIFIFNDLSNFRNLMNFQTLYSLMNSWRLEPFRTLHESNSRSFKDPRVIQLFDRYATYNGSDPYQAPATLKVIPHLEHNVGAFFPAKGMYSIVETLTARAQASGVDFHFFEEVKKVSIHDGTIRGLETEKGSYAFDKVIVNTDVFTFNHMLSDKPQEKPEQHEMSSSAVIFYWGMKIRSEKLLLHNILFSKDYKKEFDYLFNKKEVFEDPTVYIFISSKQVKEDAPAGHENWYVMINAPENTGQDWETFTKKVRRHVVEKIDSMLGIRVSDHLLFEHIANPSSIEQNTGSYHGSLYGLSSNNIWSAFRRHPNYLKKTKGLYFVGGSVHPGGGIPLCLASARIVSNLFPNAAENDR